MLGVFGYSLGACNDDLDGSQSIVGLSVTAGTEYLVGITGYGRASGEFQMELFGPPCASGDADANGIPDECDDCNENGTRDGIDISGGTSNDVNENNVPDECEDCNRNGVVDEYDITTDTSLDCNLNGVPDECDFESGFSPDCQPNGLVDDCEIRGVFAQARDSYADAEPVCPGVFYAGSWDDVKTDGSCSCSELPGDMWHRYTPLTDGTLAVSLNGSFEDSSLSIHTACPGTEENEVACTRTFLGYQSRVVLDVAGGTHYYIRVAVDSPDFTMMMDGPECVVGDENGNGILDECEAPNCLCGDPDGDGEVTLSDFVTFARCFGLTDPSVQCGAQDFLCSDLDGSGEVTLNDFATFVGLFGQPATGSPPNCE